MLSEDSSQGYALLFATREETDRSGSNVAQIEGIDGLIDPLPILSIGLICPSPKWISSHRNDLLDGEWSVRSVMLNHHCPETCPASDGDLIQRFTAISH
jgi:hypothetical protein